MRILLVHDFYQIPGGEDSVVQEEFALLRNNGVDVELFSVSNNKIKGGLGALAAGLMLVYNPWSRRALAKKLATFAPDVVHVHNFFPLLSPSIFDACRKAGVPSVMTLHNFRMLCPSPLLYPEWAFNETSLTRSCWWTIPKRAYRNSALATLSLATMIEFHKWNGTWTRKVDRFVALSNSAKETFTLGGLPADRIVVKPNCTARPSAGHSNRRDGALFVGRLDEQKGLKTLLEAWESVDYPLTIIGDGPLASLVLKSKRDCIRYLGRQPRAAVMKEMQCARFLVLPSLAHEMFPMTVVEAFANQLPVIGSQLPSLIELIIPNITGLTFPPADASALADQVRWAAAHPSALDDLGERARAIYEERYTPEVNFKGLLSIYQSL
jgi:glycosyltransferase involved in cell wall biosynthesis